MIPEERFGVPDGPIFLREPAKRRNVWPGFSNIRLGSFSWFQSGRFSRASFGWREGPRVGWSRSGRARDRKLFGERPLEIEWPFPMKKLHRRLSVQSRDRSIGQAAGGPL